MTKDTNSNYYIFENDSLVIMFDCWPDAKSCSNVIDTGPLKEYDFSQYPESMFKEYSYAKSWRLKNGDVFLEEISEELVRSNKILRGKEGIIYYEKTEDKDLNSFYLFKAFNIFEYCYGKDIFAIGKWYIKGENIYLYDYKLVNLNYWFIEDYPPSEVNNLPSILEIHGDNLLDKNMNAAHHHGEWERNMRISNVTVIHI